MPTTISAADWKKLLKAHPKAEEAAPLTRALEEFGRAEGKDDPEQLVEALDAVLSRAQAAKKKNAKVKELVGYLDDLIDDADKEKARAERDAARRAEEEEDEDTEAAELRTALVRVRKLDADGARPFVLALGAVGGLVIPKRAPITKDHRKRAKEMRTGKGKILIGRCYGEGGKYVFEFEDKPAGGITKVIKKAVKVHTTMEIRLKVRGAGEEIDDEADLAEMTDFGSEAESEEAAASPAERVKARAKEVRALLDRLKAADAGRAAPLVTRFATALGHAQAGRHEQAEAIVDEVGGLARSALRAAGAAGDESEAEDTDEPDPAADWQRRVAAVTPGLKAGLQRGGESAQELKLRFSEANVFARKQDYDRANDLLDQVEALLGPNPTARVGAGVPPPPPPPPPGGDGLAAFKLRAKGLKTWLDGLKGMNPVQHAALSRQLVAALGRAQKDVAGADQALDEIEELLGSLPASAAGDEAPTPAEKSAPKLSYTKASLAWQAALKKVRADVGRLTKAMVDEFAGEVHAGRAVQAAERVRLSLGVFDESLAEVLDQALNAETPEARQERHDAAAKMIRTYRARLDADPLIALLDANPFVPVAIHKTLATTLSTLESKLG
jgi:hypothetical protein